MEEIHSFHGNLACGLSDSLSGSVDTFITHCVVMEKKGTWSLTKKKSWLMDTILRLQPSINKFYECKWHGCPCLESTNDEVEWRYHKNIHLENQV